MTMRVLIQDAESRLYVAPQNGWSWAAPEARDFSFTAYAREVAQRLGMKRFRIVLHFPGVDVPTVVSSTEDDSRSVTA
jgi:hypothetical protein